MSVDSVCAAIVAPQHAVVDELLASLGVEAVRVDPAQLDGAPLQVGDAGRVVWMHMVPALPASGFDEAALLVASAQAAERTAQAAGVPLTFLALLPSQGLFEGDAGLSCELARGAFDALMRSQIGAWSARGDRIVGIAYAGLEGHVLDGQRPVEDVRRRIPIGRLLRVEQLADAVRYLGSSSATYVTGTVVNVDGGWRAYSWIYPARTI